MAKSQSKTRGARPNTPERATAPKLPYQPQLPKQYRPGIGVIACGGITGDHLKSYRKAGLRVVALCDVDRARAEQRRDEFYPQAAVHRDYREVLAREDVEVADLAAHPHQRVEMLQAALEAGKHVLSQKPFVLDLDFGARMADLADAQGVKLAVNQNARWAPHYSYVRQAIHAGLLGELSAAHLAVHWDHTWVAGTPFDEVKHLILYDFAIHWFDLLTCFFGERRPLRVYASIARTHGQQVKPAMLGQALIEYAGAQATLAFDADTRFGPLDETYVTGERGTIRSTGASLHKQKVTLYTAEGAARPRLAGRWFPDAFRGTMGELLRAVEEDREPENSARSNLRSLALCFAAVASAERHAPVVPGEVTRMPE